MARDDYSRDWQQAMSGPRPSQEEIQANIVARAGMEKEFYRLLIEDFTSLLSRQQSWMLAQIGSMQELARALGEQQAAQAVQEALVTERMARLVPPETIRTLIEQMQDLTRRVAALEASQDAEESNGDG